MRVSLRVYARKFGKVPREKKKLKYPLDRRGRNMV